MVERAMTAVCEQYSLACHVAGVVWGTWDLSAEEERERD